MSTTAQGKPGSPSARLIGKAPDVSHYLVLAFLPLLLSHVLAAIYAPIQDCDEVFNYWEPTHYLTNFHGLQTWEYAPQHAIRSWSYAALHALVINALQRPSPSLSKRACFFMMRVVFALVCAVCETTLFAAITRIMSERLAVLYVIITVASPGMYHASIAYLPSSFAMYAAMLGAAAFMNWHDKLKTAQGIFWFGLGACLGWPFAVALSIPFLVEELSWAWLIDTQGRLQFFSRVSTGIIYALAALAMQIGFDSLLYRKLVVVPLNIVLYNVFSSKGPDLYGTEPWHFYVRNLILNFHVWLPLALLALPILIIQLITSDKRGLKTRGLAILAPFYLWLAIFTLQPHKEERFMYPAYPFLILSAAYTLNSALAFLGNTRHDSKVARISVSLRLFAILAFLAVALAFTGLRVLGTWTAFGAPLQIYNMLDNVKAGGNVCLGKEWYRFPSHYFLPDGFEARFIRSEFHGLLPGEFQPDPRDDLKWFSAASAIPIGMNDENLEDPGKYVEIEQCDYLVDSHLPSTITTSLEPDYIHDEETWQVLECQSFLDAASTPMIPRLFWTPDHPAMPTPLRRVWGQYCLLKRRMV